MEKGGKAYGLEKLTEGGFKVPSFFVCDSTSSDKDILANIDDLLPGVSFFAVRSSAKGEDSKKQSFAGHFYSAVGVSRERVTNEVEQVVASFKGRPGSVIVQEFIPSDAAGVMFTEVNKESVVINATTGLCIPVVDGEACDEYVCDTQGAILNKIIQEKTAQLFINGELIREKIKKESLEKAQIKRLIELAADVQKFFGSPQDIEWCIKGAELYVLQSRPITADFITPKREYFDSANIAESYSGIVLPLTCSFAKMVYEQVYKDLLRMSGVSKKKLEKNSNIFENLLGFFYGRMYYNMNNWYRMAEFVPGYRRNKQNFELMITSNIKEEVGTAIKPSAVLKAFYPLIVAAKVAVFGVTSAYFKFSVKKHLRRLREHDFAQLTYEECVHLFNDLNEKLLRRWYITLENDFFVMSYLGVLKKTLGEKNLQQALVFPSKATEQVSALASLSKQMSRKEALWQTIESEDLHAFNGELPRHQEISRVLADYLHSFGGRFANELKLESIGVDEDTRKLFTVLKAYRHYSHTPPVGQPDFVLPFPKKIIVEVVLRKFKKYASRREEFRLPIQRVHGGLGHLDGRHLGGRGPSPKPLHERLDGSPVTTGEHLDATVGEVARVAAQPQVPRSLLRGRPVEHSLHATAHQHLPHSKFGFMFAHRVWGP